MTLIALIALITFSKNKNWEKRCYPQHGTLAWTYPHILALLVGLRRGGGGGGQNKLLDNGNYKITNKGYAANLTSFWLGGPTHLHEMEAMKNETYYFIESSHNRSASI